MTLFLVFVTAAVSTVVGCLLMAFDAADEIGAWMAFAGLAVVVVLYALVGIPLPGGGDDGDQIEAGD